MMRTNDDNYLMALDHDNGITMTSNVTVKRCGFLFACRTALAEHVLRKIHDCTVHISTERFPF